MNTKPLASPATPQSPASTAAAQLPTVQAPTSPPWAKGLVTLLAGALFGFGLSLSTMIQPTVVLGFLQFQDMGLMLVMGGAVLVALLAYQLAPRLMRRPLLDDHFHPHPATWNRDTAVGAALFGVGWGLCGVCPGPAIAGLGTANWDLLWALAGIALGALAQGWRARA